MNTPYPLYTVEQTAEALLACAKRRNIGLSNLKLQKLLYYAHGWSLAMRKAPLFNARIEAWVHGPVVSTVFGRYKVHRWDDIPVPPSAVPLVPDLASWVDAVLASYGSYSPKDLERMTHNEKPWIEARAGLAPDVPSRNPITDSAMKEFFESRLVNA